MFSRGPRSGFASHLLDTSNERFWLTCISSWDFHPRSVSSSAHPPSKLHRHNTSSDWLCFSAFEPLPNSLPWPLPAPLCVSPASPSSASFWWLTARRRTPVTSARTRLEGTLVHDDDESNPLTREKNLMSQKISQLSHLVSSPLRANRGNIFAVEPDAYVSSPTRDAAAREGLGGFQVRHTHASIFPTRTPSPLTYTHAHTHTSELFYVHLCRVCWLWAPCWVWWV